MNRIASFLVLLFVLSGCAYNTPSPDFRVDYPELEYTVIAWGNVLEAEKDLFLNDSRAYYDEDANIDVLCVKFRTQAIIELREARDLIVYVTEGLLARINADPTLAFQLNDYPFSPMNLDITIEFESFFGRFVDGSYIGRVNLEDGIVYYYSHRALNSNLDAWSQRVEPYEKAYRFSMFSHASFVPKPPVSPPPPLKLQEAGSVILK